MMINSSNEPKNLGQRGRLKFLLRDSVIYGGASAINKAFALITFPLLSRHFSVAEYGTLDYFQVLANLLALLFIFGQDSAIARFFYEHENHEERRQLISQSLLYQLSGALLLVPLLWWGADGLRELFVQADNSASLFRIILLQMPFAILINFSNNLLKWTFQRSRFLTISLGATVVQATALVLALRVLDAKLETVFMISVTTNMIFGLLGLFFVRQWLTIPHGFSRLREMLPFAIPYGCLAVMSSFSPTLERTLTNDILGPVDLGYYAAGTKIAMLLGMVINAFQTAWGPFSLSLYKDPDVSKTYNWVLKLFALLMCGLVFGIALIAQPVINLLASQRYQGAVVVVIPLALGVTIQAISWITEIGIGLSKRSYLNFYVYPVSLAATLGGILWLGPRYGLIGVAYGVLIGHMVRAILASWLAQQAFRLNWEYKPVLVIVILAVLLSAASLWIEGQLGRQAHLAALTLSLVTILGMGWAVLFSRAEKNKLISIVSSRLTT